MNFFSTLVMVALVLLLIAIAGTLGQRTDARRRSRRSRWTGGDSSGAWFGGDSSGSWSGGHHGGGGWSGGDCGGGAGGGGGDGGGGGGSC